MKCSWEMCIFPRVFHNNSLCKIWGANRVHYGELENREYISSLQKVQVKQNHVARLIFFANIHIKDTESALLFLNLLDALTIYFVVSFQFSIRMFWCRFTLHPNSKETAMLPIILYFPIPHNALCLPPKFCINYCCERLLRDVHIPKSISQQ